MAVSKVVLGNQTVMDITDSTVDAGSLLAGKKAYGANGEAVTGTLVVSDRIRWNEAKTSVKKNQLFYDLASLKLINTSGTWNDNAYTIHGITFTVNTDGSITANNTATAEGANFIIYSNNNESCPYNGYILSGCPNGGSGSTYDLRVSDVTTGSNQDYGSEVTISLSDTGKWNTSILIRAYQEVSNLTFYPMIRLASIEDNTYVPYIPDNVELNEKIPIKIEGKTYTAENVTALVKAVMDELTASGDFSNRSFLGGVVWSGQDYHQIEGYAHSRYVKGILSRGDAMFLFSYDKNNGNVGVSTINPSSYYAAKSGDTFTGRVSFTSADNTVKVNFRPENSDYYSTIQHQTGGNEATVFATKNEVTSYIFANGEDAIGNNGNGTRWYNLVPGLQIKKNKVSIGKLIASGVDPTYQLDVGGSFNVDGNVYKNGIQVDLETHLDQTATTSTTDPTVYTFTDARITANSAIDVYADIFGVSPSSVVASAGTCTVTFPKQDTAQSMTCRIYIK